MRGTVFYFFSGKNGPINGGFLVENGTDGTVLRFFVFVRWEGEWGRFA